MFSICIIKQWIFIFPSIILDLKKKKKNSSKMLKPYQLFAVTLFCAVALTSNLVYGKYFAFLPAYFLVCILYIFSSKKSPFLLHTSCVRCLVVSYFISAYLHYFARLFLRIQTECACVCVCRIELAILSIGVDI